jgi:hypothetical protein
VVLPVGGLGDLGQGRALLAAQQVENDGLLAALRLSPMLAAVDDEKAIHRMMVAEVSALLKKVSKAVADAGL